MPPKHTLRSVYELRSTSSLCLRLARISRNAAETKQFESPGRSELLAGCRVLLAKLGDVGILTKETLRTQQLNLDTRGRDRAVRDRATYLQDINDRSEIFKRPS